MHCAPGEKWYIVLSDALEDVCGRVAGHTWEGGREVGCSKANDLALIQQRQSIKHMSDAGHSPTQYELYVCNFQSLVYS